jgi:hypothetical protein
MAFPTTQITTSNLDSSTDDPSQARADLLDAVQKLNTIIDEAGTAQGVALLDASGLLDSTQIPTSISASGTQILSPATGIVNIQDRLRLTTFTNAQILALSGPQLGDMVIAANINGSAGPGVAFYDGSNWKATAFSGFTTLT